MHENQESEIARFVTVLRREIQNVVELYEYTFLEKLVHLVIKVESQLLSGLFLPHLNSQSIFYFIFCKLFLHIVFLSYQYE